MNLCLLKIKTIVYCQGIDFEDITMKEMFWRYA